MNISKHNVLLVLIIGIAALLRFWHLGLVPPSPDWDEAALGYNAYSILKTGKDEYGTPFPLVLRSFDDYKPPLYMYLTIPSVAIFGLHTWSVRLPAAICGTLAVLGVFFLISEFLTVFKLSQKRWKPLPYIVTFLLAISPWHIQFSRIAFEANIGVFLNIWALYFFFRGLRSGVFLSMSALTYGLSLYAYHSQRVFVPLLGIILLILFRKQLFLYPKRFGISAVVALLVALPVALLYLSPASWTRLKGTSALSDTTALLARSVQKLQADQETGNRIGTFFDNRRIVFAQKIFEGYISHFSLRWLFLTGDNDRHHAPDTGILYLWELPILFLGIITVGKNSSKASKFLFAWLFLAPVAASPTSETPHAIRSLVMLPLPQIYVAFGLLRISEWLRVNRNVLFYVPVFMYTVFIVWNTASYVHMYFAHTNNEYSLNWQYGYKEAVDYAVEHYDKYEKIVVSQKLEQPHMFFLFYLQYDPELYLAEGGTKSGGFAEVRNAFDKYEFRFIDWENEKHDGRTLYIGTPQDIKDGYIKTYINFLNGKGAIRISE